MRGEDRTRRKGLRIKNGEDMSIKNALYIAGTILALGIIAFVITVMVYNDSLDRINGKIGKRETKELDIKKDKEEVIQTETASSSIGKTIQEMQNEIKQSTEDTKEEISVYVEKSQEEKEEPTEQKQEGNVKENEEKKTLQFSYPVEGEIIREYARDNLVYSETLKEWITHTGIDIKADKTTIVKSAEDGTVTAIKNDPRFGTTVIVEHEDGFETRYANLLTAEFVTIGENVTKGQTLGTVGNTAAFEVMDDYHLHFELLKNGEFQDPTGYLK